jgi:hypothetical protein
MLCDAQGGVPVDGLEVRAPGPDDPVAIEIQIGYRVTGAGRYARRGVELIYEYQGEVRRKVIPSQLAICAPATTECEPENP